MTGDLAAAMPAVARALLGDPVAHLSTAAEWRYGRRGSLAIDVKRGLWCDHEAATGGGVIDLIRRELGGDTAAALRWLGEADSGFVQSIAGARGRVGVRKLRTGPDDAARIAAALRIWDAAKAPEGTLAEAYLASRGLALGLLGDRPESRIRFAQACPFGPGTRHPAMLVLLTDIATGEPTGIRRTALVDRGKAFSGAGIERARDPGGGKLPHKALGVVGNAAARLSEDTRPPASLALCEGVETGLSVIAAIGATVWACPAGTLAKIPVLPGVERLTIYADNDPPGLAAARTLAGRWRAAGRQTAIETPIRDGADFNDLWMENHLG